MPKVQIEIHQKDMSDDGVFLVWYRDAFSNLRCELKTDDDIATILTHRQFTRFVKGDYTFTVPASDLIGC